jgi:hypothetical protein
MQAKFCSCDNRKFYNDDAFGYLLIDEPGKSTVIVSLSQRPRLGRPRVNDVNVSRQNRRHQTRLRVSCNVEFPSSEGSIARDTGSLPVQRHGNRHSQSGAHNNVGHVRLIEVAAVVATQ